MSANGLHLADHTRPWIGLASFTEGDREFFAGRGEESDDLLRLVRRDTLTLLYGVSGLGKTSLLQAGLFPRLRADDCLPLPMRIDHVDDSVPLSAQVHRAIENAAAAAGVECPEARAEETLWEYFHRRGHDFWSRRNEPVTPVIVLDQFEEFFTVGRETPERARRAEAFIAELAELVENRAPAAIRADPQRGADFDFRSVRLKVLLSMREDYLADLDRLRSRFRDLGQSRLRLLPMGQLQARAVIALGAPLLAPGVEERVLAFVAGSRSAAAEEDTTTAPALLSLVLRELNERRLARGAEAKITADLLDTEQAKILEDFYLRSLDGFPAGTRIFIEDALLTAGGYRNSCALDDALAREGVTQDILDALVNRRLLAYEDRHRTRRVELTHDVLIEVVRTSRDQRREREAREQAERAQEQQRQSLLKASRDLRRFRAAAAVFLVLTVAAIGGAIWAFLAQRQAEKAQGQAEGAQRQAQDSLNRMLDRLRIQLGSLNGELAVSALDELSRERGEESALGMVIPAERLQSTEWFANVSFALEQLAGREAQRVPWGRSVRQKLLVRLINERKIKPPPSAADDEWLNRRVLIAAGSFQMGSRESGFENERPQHEVALSAFRIQEHEVTNAEYWRFDPHHDADAPAELPVVNVSWDEAMVYAAWLGGNLPTEAQWEFAARGKEGRAYPWGNQEPTKACDRANYDACGRQLKPVKTGREGGKTLEGVYDLAGNAWEWCRDLYGPYTDEKQMDPLGSESGSARVVRGGTFLGFPRNLRGARRFSDSPGSRSGYSGFRVVWSSAGGLD